MTYGRSGTVRRWSLFSWATLGEIPPGRRDLLAVHPTHLVQLMQFRDGGGSGAWDGHSRQVKQFCRKEDVPYSQAVVFVHQEIPLADYSGDLLHRCSFTVENVLPESKSCSIVPLQRSVSL